MNERDVILGQVDQLQQCLVRAMKAIDSPQVDASLRTRVVPRFETDLGRLDAQRTSLEQRIKADSPLGDSWRELRELEDKCARLFDECLAFIQGAFARAHGLDAGACATTDVLLDDLSRWSDVPWNRFTLVATSEFYRATAGIIRIRYPEVSFWSLPLAAHEFGHFAGPALRESRDGGYDYPFQAKLTAADQTRTGPLHTLEWNHLQEYFADVFATYTLGPAYAAAFILLRMNPHTAHAETLTHPSGAARVHGILQVLDKMDLRQATALSSPFRAVTDWLRSLWVKGLAAAGQPTTISAPSAALVDQRTSELWDMIVGLTPERLAFGRSGWLRAQGLAADLTVPSLDDELTRRDVLNAAWLARLQAGIPDVRTANDIAHDALGAYRRIPVPAN